MKTRDLAVLYPCNLRVTFRNINCIHSFLNNKNPFCYKWQVSMLDYSGRQKYSKDKRTDLS